jgi:hypothetical protein
MKDELEEARMEADMAHLDKKIAEADRDFYAAAVMSEPDLSPAVAAVAAKDKYVRPQVVCPHCQMKGCVEIKEGKKKHGISGAKATAAIFTAGISLLGTGLAKKDKGHQAHCLNCGMDWWIE